jgi:xanthosine utilization system XapX-like protein
VASRSPAPPALEDIFGAVGVAVHQQANNANRHLIGGSVVETVTIRLEPRKDALISARQAVLDGGTSTPAVFAGTEEEDAQYDGWYDCIAQDAHRMEQLDDPEL